MNNERSQTCSSIDNRTLTPYFSLRTIQHLTSNIVQPITSFYIVCPHITQSSLFETNGSLPKVMCMQNSSFKEKNNLGGKMCLHMFICKSLKKNGFRMKVFQSRCRCSESFHFTYLKIPKYKHSLGFLIENLFQFEIELTIGVNKNFRTMIFN